MDERNNESKLIDSAKSGDIEAFEELIKNYQKKVFNFAYYLTGNKIDAENISQEAFIKVFKYIKNFRGESKFSLWLFRIVKNTFINEYKSKLRESKYVVPLDTNNHFEKISDDTEINNQTHREVVEKLLKRIHLKFRVPVIMYHLQGFTYEEIAKILKVSIGTVKSRISRGRERLRKYKKEIYP